jgi:asparagine synthase (glutamine-hydrolysing)
MSGIAGIVRFDGQPVFQGQIQSMLDQMPYRGPDGMACWTDNCVGLGHAMLHTTPESLHAAAARARAKPNPGNGWPPAYLL